MVNELSTLTGQAVTWSYLPLTGMKEVGRSSYFFKLVWLRGKLADRIFPILQYRIFLASAPYREIKV